MVVNDSVLNLNSLNRLFPLTSLLAKRAALCNSGSNWHHRTSILQHRELIEEADQIYTYGEEKCLGYLSLQSGRLFCPWKLSREHAAKSIWRAHVLEESGRSFLQEHGNNAALNIAIMQHWASFLIAAALQKPFADIFVRLQAHPSIQGAARHDNANAMDHTLRCNVLKCRKELNDHAVVTTCR